LGRYRPLAGYVSKQGEVWLRHSEALRMLDECEDERIVVLGFDLARVNSDGTRTMFPPIADFELLLDEPDPVTATVTEARMMLHDEMPATELQKEWKYPPASLVSFVLQDEETLRAARFAKPSSS
jgi:hypothetical protein